VRARHGDEWRVSLVPGLQRSYFVEPDERGRRAEEVVVSAVDRAGREGPSVSVRPVARTASRN
jgi:hypothetical protein